MQDIVSIIQRNDISWYDSMQYTTLHLIAQVWYFPLGALVIVCRKSRSQKDLRAMLRTRRLRQDLELVLDQKQTRVLRASRDGRHSRQTSEVRKTVLKHDMCCRQEGAMPCRPKPVFARARLIRGYGETCRSRRAMRSISSTSSSSVGGSA